MKRSFTRKLALSFCLILAFFSVSLAVFELPREKKHKREIMEERLDSYAEMIYPRFFQRDGKAAADSLPHLFPDSLRITVIDRTGKVLFDNRLDDLSQTENHAGRPEIRKAAKTGKGSDIRLSASTRKPYLYYAKRLGNHYIRVALPYNPQIRRLLKPDGTFVYYLLLLSTLGIAFTNYTARRFGRIIKRLSDYSIAVGKNLPVTMPNFPDDETGTVSRQIAEEYRRLKESEVKLSLEHQKLLMHIQSSAEGICFFTPDRKVAFYNGLFLQYLNILSDQITVDASTILDEAVFSEVIAFLDERKDRNYFETSFYKQGKFFTGRVNVFEDQNFEIVLNDNTRQEQNKLLKRELTGNIAHELRTPVTGIRGYLETILDNQLDREKEREFVRKAYEQIITLSELIRDMSLLSKISESPDAFKFKPIALQDIIDKVKSDLDEALRKKNIVVRSTVPRDLSVVGSESLLYSVFRNLTDNVINHAGENLTVEIDQYSREGNLAYFSFADNGIGVKNERHLSRLFERFYRIEEGRTRDTGGSGLGLSIVKNGIAFHGGSISVKNRQGGGLEFLFTLLTHSKFK
ncbi:MAG: HAMP domain-containing histidine kinase [Dysgonamonadaceae bacterium]|jgi:signal transduction histidine kinase|nr:HAMP domain-containing histidine kinase [Dysgonamonadaceae bacterium]